VEVEKSGEPIVLERIHRFFEAMRISGLELGEILKVAGIDRSAVTRWPKPGKPDGSMPKESNMAAVEEAFEAVAVQKRDAINSGLKVIRKPTKPTEPKGD
jgi:hypothetical protein